MYIECLICAIVVILVIVYFVGSPFNYMKVKPCDTCETFKVNRSFGDAKTAAMKMQEINDRVRKLIDYMRKKYATNTKLLRGLDNINNRFSSSRFYENSPYNITNTTAYTDNKDTLYVCLRNKDGIIYDMSTLMFVTLHEITHMMIDSWGHGDEFWPTFKFLLLNARDAGVYDPIDYSKYNINYCGLVLTNNPYYY